MAAHECIVVGCGSSAYNVHDLTPNREWAGLPAEFLVCNVHKAELAQPETEWMLVRDEGKLYVGDSLRNLNEYVLLGVETIEGYGTTREFSHGDEDGLHMNMRVRRRGDREKEMVLVLTSNGVSKDFKHWATLLPPFDD